MSQQPSPVVPAQARRWLAGVGGDLPLRVLDELFAFVGILDAEGTLLYANAAPLQAGGLSADDVRGRKFWDCPWWSSSPEARERVRQACHSAAQGEVVRYDAVVRMARDSDMTIDFQVSPLRDASGAVTHLVPTGIDISLRKAAEAQLRRSEELVRTIAENSTQGLAMMDARGYCTYANKAWLEMTGYGGEEIRSRPLHDLVHHHRPDGSPYPMSECPIDRALPENFDVRAHEDLFFRKDGSAFPVLCAASPIFKDGRPVATVVEIRDVTQARQAEAEIRHREQLAQEAAARAENERAVLEAILEAAPAGIILADAAGRLVRYNRANERLWGSAPLAQSVEEYGQWKAWWADNSPRHGRPVQPDEWAMSRALHGETVQDQVLEIEPFGNPGVRRTIINSGAPVRAADGSIRGAVVAQMDITALLTAQKAQRESEAQFRALADNIPQLAWMTDATGFIYWYNRRWFEYTGSTLEQMLGWGWKSVHHPEHVARVERKFRHHMESGEPWEDTFPLRGRDGQYRWFLSRAFPLRDETGAIVSWFGSNTDVTEQREAQEKLREADRHKDEFIATLAHELRNPLAPVRNAVEILSRVPATDPKIARARDIIGRQVRHMAGLIDDLLDVARIARGQLQLSMVDCDLGSIVWHTADDYRANLEADGCPLTVTLPRDPLTVSGDPVRLSQMLANYLQNAQRFGAGRPVVVEACADESARQAVVSVRDHGAGIAPELLPKLFQTFRHADQGLARTQGGLGLGLALTRGLAELHGGSVGATSAGLGQGAIFEFRIPLAAPGRTAGAVPARCGRADAGGNHVLVIEDNLDAAETMQLLLEAEGYTVLLAHDANSGLQLARMWLPETIVCDIGLPGMNGYEVAAAVRADPKLASALLVALSGYADSEARARARAAGFDVHLAKPVEPEELLRRLASHRPGAADG